MKIKELPMRVLLCFVFVILSCFCMGIVKAEFRTSNIQPLNLDYSYPMELSMQITNMEINYAREAAAEREKNERINADRKRQAVNKLMDVVALKKQLDLKVDARLTDGVKKESYKNICSRVNSIVAIYKDNSDLIAAYYDDLVGIELDIMRY